MSSHLHITKHDIAMAKKACARSKDPLHEHDDCIRIAYEWLDAQIPIKNSRSKLVPLKHIIESWAGRYVSQSDVEVAVHLHPYFKGVYPRYNFSTKMVEPNIKRLEHIAEAFTQKNYRENHDPSLYHSKE
jgi:hypothetical protein